MKKIEIIFAGLVALILIALLVPLPKAHAVLPLGSPLAGVVNCASSASCATPAYMAGGETVIGHATLATGTVTITGQCTCCHDSRHAEQPTPRPSNCDLPCHPHL